MAAKKKSKSTVNKAGNYTKPGMRKRIFNRIKAGGKGGAPGQWSARKAQIATARYKKAGGGYKGKKSSSNRLSKWSKQKWGYVSKGDEKKPRAKRGRYLPKRVRSRLTKSQKAATNRKKRKAGGVGSRAKYSKKIRKAVRGSR